MWGVNSADEGKLASFEIASFGLKLYCEIGVRDWKYKKSAESSYGQK